MLDRHLTGDPAVLASSSPILDLLHASSLHLLALGLHLLTLGLAVLDAIGLIGTRLLAVRGADLLALDAVGARLLALRPHLLTVGPLRPRLLALGALRASLLTFDARLLALSPLWAPLRNLLRSSPRRLGAHRAAATLHLGGRAILGAAGTRRRGNRNGQRGNTCG